MNYHKYMFNWYSNTKYSTPIERHNLIEAIDAKTATSHFMAVFGNLKKNTINYIQEIDENGKNIGQPIIPESGTEKVRAI